MSKNLDETVRLQYEKRQEWIREITAEKLQEIAEGSSSVSRLASSSAASFPREKRVFGEALQPDKTGEKRQLLPESLK